MATTGGAAARGLPLTPVRPQWPDRSLDIADLRSSGWRPTPFRDVVLKVHQRCNLVCDYCYVYTKADQSWRQKPRDMAPRTWRAAAHRLAEHATSHGLADVRLVLHGGEPLLLGRRRLAELLADFRAIVGTACRLHVRMQTNGVLLDEDILAVLHEHRVRVGVSIDGAAADNDRHRHSRDGSGSHLAVDRALRRLTSPAHRDRFAGLLCTVDPRSDPVGCYETLLAYEPPSVDFLLPHANWSDPPPRGPADATPYGDWLAAVFDRWYGAARQETRVRLLEDIVTLVLGGSSRSEQVGLSPVAVVVVESDGAIEQVDSLKSAYPGACETGLNVFDHALDAALSHPGVVARQIGLAALADRCRSCPVGSVCGGGHFAHRYRAGSGFRHPTVYCTDMLRLIRHVAGRVTADLRQRMAAS